MWKIKESMIGGYSISTCDISYLLYTNNVHTYMYISLFIKLYNIARNIKIIAILFVVQRRIRRSHDIPLSKATKTLSDNE